MNEFPDVEVPVLGRTLYGGGETGGITAENHGYWRAAAEGIFSLPTCDNCGTQRWPISPVCWSCHAMRWSWQATPAAGRVYTFTWIEEPEPARNVAVIELDEARGGPVRVPGWVVGVRRDQLTCGMPVRGDFELVAEGIGVPFWRPVT